ncbi:MAG: FecR family protein [Candidatus Cyclobacteriaceae bacterium M2_1C_046]
MKNEEYIKKWLEGSLTEEERIYFESTEEYRSIQKLSDSLMAFKAPEYDAQAGLERLHKTKASQKGKGKIVKIDFLRPLLKIAAVFIIMISIYFYFFSDDIIRIETAVAEKTEVLLPDSSIVVLNALSSLTYNEDQWSEEREVILTGEAFFKVKNGSTFDVNTNKGIVTVVGTEFNVKIRDEYFEVICYEGLVQVKALEQKVSLSANHIFKLEDGVFTKELKTVTPHLLTDESAFYSVPFSEVIREIERQYNVEVEANGIDLQKRFTGRFVHSDLQMALKSVTIPMDLNYQITQDQRILLSGEDN